MDPKDALPIERRNDLFRPGYFPVEVGYCVAENGTGYIANLTKMPGVTPQMFEWWFAWHGLNDMRYRIWDPEDHFYARQQMPEKVLDPKVPMREKTWGTVHHVLEDIGPGPDELILNFQYPHVLGYDEEKIGTELCATMMCANGHGPKPGEGVAAYFVRILFIVILIVLLMSGILMFCEVGFALGLGFFGFWFSKIPGVFLVAYITALIVFIPCTKAAGALCGKD